MKVKQKWTLEQLSNLAKRVTGAYNRSEGKIREWPKRRKRVEQAKWGMGLGVNMLQRLVEMGVKAPPRRDLGLPNEGQPAIQNLGFPLAVADLQWASGARQRRHEKGANSRLACPMGAETVREEISLLFSFGPHRATCHELQIPDFRPSTRDKGLKPLSPDSY